MSKIAVALSGGADSAVAALMLKDRGHEVIGLYMHLKDNDPELYAAEHVASVLGIDFEAVDLRQQFDKEIKATFAAAYCAGMTPNPCVNCNQKLKFGSLLDRALELGCQSMATGHYAVCDKKSIRRADYAAKDQTYCLWRISKERLQYIDFPLGTITKPEVKKIAEDAGLVGSQKKESMDICFIEEGDYRRFLTEYTGNEGQDGKFVLSDGTFLAMSHDQRCYTVGQRKGLGIAYKHPLYVVSKDAASNTVVLGDERELYRTEVNICDCRWQQYTDDSFDAPVQLRFRAKDALAHITKDGDKALLEFKSPVRAPSPGQSAVVYSPDGILLGGGIIMP